MYLLFLLHAVIYAQTICLNMIVKNESEVIEQCLASAKPLIDYWVIVDTGSTDGTQEIIKNCLRDIPGELHERPWVHFEHNRNEAFEFAKRRADYVLWIDADERFVYDEKFSFGPLDQDCYYLVLRQLGAADCLRPSLLSAQLPWKWKGVIHEFLDDSIAKKISLLSGITTLCDPHAPSGRSKDPDKYLKDALLLEEALKKEPENSRYVFYLAQSYLAAQNYKLALKHYEKRASMPSLDVQETFFALYNTGKIKEILEDFEGALKSFYQAYEFRPSRAEALFRAAVIHRKMGHPELGYILSQYALTLPVPKENCVEYGAYDYAIQIELANCALLTKKWKEGLKACKQLLSNPTLPEEVRVHVLQNHQLATENLAKKKIEN